MAHGFEQTVAVRRLQQASCLGWRVLRVHGPDRVDHRLAWQAVRIRGLGLARAAAAQAAALGEEFRVVGCAMNGAIDATPAQQRRVRRIDDRIDL